MNEGDLSRKIIARLNARPEAFFWKVAQTGGPDTKRGISDILGCYKSLFVALEVKLPTNRKGTTDIQEAFLDKIRGAGGFAYEVRTIAEAEAVLNVIDEAVEP